MIFDGGNLQGKAERQEGKKEQWKILQRLQLTSD
jgi:hypothetical protein